VVWRVGSAPAYFASFEEWPPYERQAMRYWLILGTAMRWTSTGLLLMACASWTYRGAFIRLPPVDSKVSEQDVRTVVAVVMAFQRGWAAMEPSPADRLDETGLVSQYGNSAGPGGASFRSVGGLSSKMSTPPICVLR